MGIMVCQMVGAGLIVTSGVRLKFLVRMCVESFKI